MHWKLQWRYLISTPLPNFGCPEPFYYPLLSFIKLSSTWKCLASHRTVATLQHASTNHRNIQSYNRFDPAGMHWPFHCAEWNPSSENPSRVHRWILQYLANASIVGQGLSWTAWCRTDSGWRCISATNSRWASSSLLSACGIILLEVSPVVFPNSSG